MVRRGSTVRVRQRALKGRKSPEIGDCCCLRQHSGAPPHCFESAIGLAALPANYLQIAHFPWATGHLLEIEEASSPHSPWATGHLLEIEEASSRPVGPEWRKPLEQAQFWHATHVALRPDDPWES